MEAEHIDDEMFQQADEDYSYAKQNLGTKLQKDIDDAKAREVQRRDTMIAKTKARAVRMEATSELAKYYGGDVAIPIEIYLSKKHKKQLIADLYNKAVDMKDIEVVKKFGRRQTGNHSSLGKYHFVL